MFTFSRWRDWHQLLNTSIHCFVELEVFLLTATALSSSILSLEISGNLVECTFCSFWVGSVFVSSLLDSGSNGFRADSERMCPIFVSLLILKFEDIIKLQIGKVMYPYKNGLLPNSFNDMYCFCLTVTYILITLEVIKNSFRLPYWRTNVRKFSLCFQGPKIFNSLSSEIQNASNTALFNSKFNII